MVAWWSGRRRLWVALGLVAALILFMPLRVALGMAGLGTRGLTARSVVGTIWYGGLVDAHFGDIDLGNVRASLSPIGLLTGELRFRLHGVTVSSAVPLDGSVAAGLTGQGISGMTGEVPVGQVFAPLPISALVLDDAGVRFRGGICTSASGRVTAKLAGGIDGVPGLALPRALSGAARCDGGRLVLPLVSQPGTESITLSIAGDGGYKADLTLQPGDPAVAEKLRLAGFIEGPKGYRLSIDGRF